MAILFYPHHPWDSITVWAHHPYIKLSVIPTIHITLFFFSVDPRFKEFEEVFSLSPLYLNPNNSQERVWRSG